MGNNSELVKSNLTGHFLRVAAVISPEYSYDTAVVQNDDGSYRLEDSFAAELLFALKLTMNFTTILVITNSWGQRLSNGSWNGMIALLLAKEADIGISSLADLPFRRKVVDFNIPTNDIKLSAFFQKPSALSTHFTTLLKPFRPFVWGAVAFLTVFMMANAFIVNGFRHKKAECKCGLSPFTTVHESSKIEAWMDKELNASLNHNFSEYRFKRSTPLLSASSIREPMSTLEDNHIPPWSDSDSIMWAFATITYKGFYKTTAYGPLRITMLAGSVAGIVLFTAYSAALVSFLSVLTDSVKTVGQLLATDFTFAVVNEQLPLKFLEESPNPRSFSVFKRKTDRNYSSMTEAADDVKKGSFVFVSDHSSAYSSLSTDFLPQESCQIKEVEIENGRQRQGTIVPKDSPYKRVLDYQILRTIQTGLVKRWGTKFLTRRPDCEVPLTYDGVEFESVSLAFAILPVVGWLLGFVGLLMETAFCKMSSINK